MEFKLSTIMTDKVEKDAQLLDETVYKIIDPFCSELDRYVKFVASMLKDGEHPPTDAELEDCCMNLSTYIYFAAGACETLGIRDDVSKALYKEAYHSARASQDSGTIADKDSMAELASREQQLTNLVYNRAYKLMKSKVDTAQELLSSCKKVLSHRMLQIEISRMGVE